MLAYEVEEPASVDYVVECDDEVISGDGLDEGSAQDVDEEHQEGNLQEEVEQLEL